MMTIQYEYPHNKIHVDTYLYPEEKSGDAEESKQRTKRLLISIKEIYQQIVRDGLFQHKGYLNKSEPQNLGEHIKRLTEFSVTSEFKGKVYTYKTSMNDNEIYFSEKKKEN